MEMTGWGLGTRSVSDPHGVSSPLPSVGSLRTAPPIVFKHVGSGAREPAILALSY